ncbi:hypothetical protein ABEO47_14035 [Heyndrickxia faecalis]
MIHTFEMMLLIAYYDVQHLFSMYSVNINKYDYFGAAVRQLNSEVKKRFPAYSITWMNCRADGDWHLHLKVDAVKLLNRGEIIEDDYDLIESDIRKFLIRHFGHSDYFDSHTLTRIDYRMDVEMPNPKDRELLFHLLEKYTAK